MPRDNPLPISLPPRGLSLPCAAAYVGVGLSKFSEMVVDGRMPKPRTIDTRRVWDRFQLDEAFSALPSNDDGDEPNPWDQVA